MKHELMELAFGIESVEDIAASYGIVMTADGRFERA